MRAVPLKRLLLQNRLVELKQLRKRVEKRKGDGNGEKKRSELRTMRDGSFELAGNC
jgi:hypothetical protein